METIVNFLAGYGSIIVGDFLIAELLGIASICIVLGIMMGKWEYQPKRRESSLE
jgi:hypothetical protein